MVFCDKCGAENPDDADRCEVCDAKLKKPLRLFKKKVKKEEEPEEKGEREPTPAEKVRGLDTTALTPAGVNEVVTDLIEILEGSGLSAEKGEVKKPAKEERELIEAIDSKVMEIEMRLRGEIRPPKLYMLMGHTYFNIGELPRAERFYEKCASQDPQGLEFLMKVAEAYISRKETDRAMGAVEKVLTRSPRHSEALYLKSQLLKDKGNLNDALRFVTEALKSDKTNERAWVLRAEIYNLLGDTQKCLDSLNAGIASIPSSISLLEKKGELLIRMGRGEEAIAMVKDALRSSGTNPNLHALLGKTLMATGDLKSAERAFDRALELDEECVSALIGMGSLLGMQGEYETAHEYLDAALEIDAKNADAHIAKSIIYAKQGNLKQALEHADHAISIHPESVDVWSAKGDLLASHGLYSEAMEIYTKILQMSRDNAGVLHKLGVTYMNLKKMNEAIAAFKRVIEVSKGYAPVYLDLGKALLELGHINEAVRVFRVYADLRPGDSESILQIANLLKEKGRGKEAMEFFDRLEGKGEISVEVLRTKFETAKSEGDWRSAIDILKKILTREKNAAYLVELGNALFQIKNTRDAILPLEEAIELDEKNPDAWLLLGRCYFAEGNDSDALEAVDVSISLKPGEIEAYRLGVEIARRLKNGEKIIDYSSRALQYQPQNAYFLEAQGDGYKITGKDEDALSAYIKASRYSDDLVLLLKAGKCAYTMQRFAEAEGIFSKARDLAGSNPEVQKYYGLLLWRRGDRNAESYIVNALKTLKDDGELWNVMGHLLLARGDATHAVQAFERAVSLGTAEGNIGKARALIHLGKKDEAGQILARIVQEKRDTNIILEYASLMLDLGDHEEALRVLSMVPREIPPAERKRVQMLQARGYELAGDFNGALQIYLSDKDNPEALYHAARIYVGKGEFDKASSVFDALFRLNESHIDALKLKSSMLESLGEIDASLQLLERISALTPGDTETLWKRIELLKRAGRLEQTVPIYDRILSLNPSDAKARSERIGVLKSLGRGDRLLVEYDAILRSDPNNLDALIGKGSLLITGRDRPEFQTGEACLKRALEIDPENMDALLALARGYTAWKMETELERILSHPVVNSSPRGLMEKGRIYEDLGRYPASLQAYVQSLKMEQNPEVYVLAANLLLRMKEFSRAKDMADRALQKGEKIPGARRVKGLALIGMGKLEDGYNELKAASESEPGIDIFLDVAEHAKNLGRIDDAIAALDNVTKLDAGRIDAWISKGELYLKKGEWGFAIECAKKALEINPNSIDAVLLQCRASILAKDAKSAQKYAESLQTLVLKDRDTLPLSVKVDAFKLLAKGYEMVGDYDMSYKTISVYSRIVPELMDDVDVMCILGRSLIKRGLYSEGEEWLTRVLSKDRKNIEAIRELATLYLSQNRLELAEKLLSEAGEERGILLLRGELYERSGRLSDAISVYEKILTSGDDAGILRKMVDLFIRSGRFSDGIEYAERAIRVSPEDPSLRYLAGTLYLKTGQYGNALKSFTWVYKKTRGGDALLGKGIALYHLGRIKEAKTIFEDLHKRLEGDDAVSCQLYLSRALRILGDHDRALKISDSLRKLHPSNPEILEEYIHCLESVGRWTDVISLYTRMVEQNPMNTGIRKTLITYLMNAKRYREAAEEGMKLITLSPKVREGYIWTCEALVKSGNPEEATKIIDDAISRFDRDPELWKTKGEIYLTLGDPEKALGCFERILNLDPESVDGHLKKGVALLMKGDLQSAVEAIDDALSIDASRSDAWSELGTVLYCAGRDAEARMCFEHAIELDPKNEDAHHGLLELNISQNRVEEAAALMQNIKEKETPRYIYNAALIEEKKGNHVQALTLLDRGIQAYNDASLHALRGYVLLQMKRVDDALESIVHSLSIRKTHDQHLLHAVILSAMKEYPEAMEILRSPPLIESPEGNYIRGVTSLQIYEDKEWAPLGLGEQDLIQSSVDALEKAISMRSGKGKYHTALGFVYLKSGRLEKAISEFDRSLEYGENPFAWLGKGYAYIDLEMYSDAVRAANRAISLDPGLPEAWFIKGVAEINLKDPGSAEASFEKCLTLKDNAAVWRAIAYTLLNQGKTTEALTCMDKVILHHPDSPQGFIEKGIALIEARKLKDAIRAFDSALRLDRRSIEAWNGRGISLIYLGKTREAIKCFREMERLGDPVTSRFNTGVAYALAEDYLPAIREFEEILRMGRDEEAEINKQHALTEMRRRERS